MDFYKMWRWSKECAVKQGVKFGEVCQRLLTNLVKSGNDDGSEGFATLNA